MKFILSKKREEVPGVTTFVFAPEAPVSWQAGQYLHYVLPHEADERGKERWFTVSSAPFEGTPMITTRLAGEKGSTFKRALLALKAGDAIEADGPEGDFTLESASGPKVFIAGGIGITPFHSMLKQADHVGEAIDATLLYANRDERIVFKQEIDLYAAKHPEFKAHYLVDPERIDEASVRRFVPDLAAPTFFISGPEGMVKAIGSMLEGMGVAQARIKLDDFPGYPEY